MLWLHPILQVLATFVALYAGYLGMERFLSRHLGKRTQFLWKRHVVVGKIALCTWLAGLGGGMFAAKLKWSVMLVTGQHYKVAFLMLPLILFGLASGVYMDRWKQKRLVLPLLHGLGNLVLLFLAFYQFRTGWAVIRDFIL